MNGFKDLGLRIAEGGDIENYCEMIVEENPCNTLFMRKYAQLLQVILLSFTFTRQNHVKLRIYPWV